MEERLAGTSRGGRLVLILDGVTDTQNLGAILRSAAAFGADFIVAAKDRAASLTPAAAKIAAGAAEIVPIVRETNLARAMEKLKDAGFWVYALEADGGQPIHAVDLRGDVALVFGSEGHGVGRLVRERSDAVLCIPIAGMESLNVAVSAACALYEVRRQRSVKDKA
ncbi:MAG: RNA methyltransferase [Deltaproteobacteria bacterium]|nr:RNA methyltransferase [Deltaproteobacteria bacterium]